MQAPKINPIDLIPKLKDERNYQAWAQQLRRAAREFDRDMLSLIEGKWRPAIRKARIKPCDDRIRKILASHYRCRERDIRRCEIKEWTSKNITDLNDELMHWTELNNKAMHLIKCSLTEKIRPRIRKIYNADEAFSTLKTLYGHSNAYTFPYWYSVWSGVIFKRGDNPREFVRQWFEALHSLLEVSGDAPLPLQFQWAQFREAIRDNPSARFFYGHAKFDLGNRNILKELADEFLESQEQVDKGGSRSAKSGSCSRSKY